MTDTLRTTKTFDKDHWYVSAELLPDNGNVLPQSIFIYENIGADRLGQYQGVCSFEELKRLQEWSGQVLPIFGNRFVRYHRADVALSVGADPDRTISLIKLGAKALKEEILSSGSSSEDTPI